MMSSPTVCCKSLQYFSNTDSIKVTPFDIYLKKDLDKVRHYGENGCGKDAFGNLVHYIMEQMEMHAWKMTAGRFDMVSLDTYKEACEKFG